MTAETSRLPRLLPGAPRPLSPIEQGNARKGQTSRSEQHQPTASAAVAPGVSMSVAEQSMKEDFAALLNESFNAEEVMEGSVVKGTIVAIEKDLAVIDVGLKTEGRIPLKEFSVAGGEPGVNVGDEVEVYLERIENALGEAVLSREKARREESWVRLEVSFNNNEKVSGVIFNQVKGGFTVDLDGAVAFLPRSQVDIRPVRDVTPLMHTPQPFQILKMDKRRGNIVVSRRTVLEETRAEQRSELVQSLEEGQVIEGVVKNITDYGAFVDLGGIDGLLHVTDIAWRRINHPSEVLSIGQTVKVQIIRVNHETHRISLGMKQLETDPWEGIEAKYPVNVRFKGRVTNITDYGAFVELEPGIEGLIHVSEMSWTKKNVHPGKIVSTSQEVEVMILEVDPVKRRISLGLKQTLDNPWETFAAEHPVGTTVEGEVKNKTEFGLFIGLDGDVDGMVHLSDLDWNRPGEQAIEDYNRGDMVQAQVLDVDVEKERISLGIKQAGSDPFAEAAGDVRKGAVVTCEVIDVKDAGIEVKIADTDLTTFIRRSDLSRDRSEQRPERFAKGEKVDARVTNFDKKNRKVTVSVKALEIAEEKEAVAQYGSSDSGASLGDILGAALRARGDEDTPEGAEADEEKS
ncbi:MAG: 30S ribosomal protein S1 [Bauldia sp.]|uniref:30S ribosomal protein S1 n=1 Tax=Bauldia sp. TaxID=2575872 RepID=UPI001DE07193|nr:30S ribosomal protein S1 [Bauldia sp.]MCB1497506.1 30S ribosomal protein S1 [Bauldia sp.]